MLYNKPLSEIEISQLYYGAKFGGDVMNSSQTTLGDNWSLGVRGGDFNAFGTEVNSSNITIVNNAPSITSLILNATSPFNLTTDNLTAHVTANDIDGNNISFWYNWYKDGSLNATTLITSGLAAYWPLNNCICSNI